MFKQQEIKYEWHEIGGFFVAAGIITLLISSII